MALNLNRGKPKKYSSSNRIASLMGNGLLTFMDNKKQFDHFFSKDEIVFFSNEIDLINKLNYYKINAKKRIEISKKGAPNWIVKPSIKCSFKYPNSTSPLIKDCLVN